MNTHIYMYIQRTTCFIGDLDLDKAFANDSIFDSRRHDTQTHIDALSKHCANKPNHMNLMLADLEPHRSICYGINTHHSIDKRRRAEDVLADSLEQSDEHDDRGFIEV